MLIYPHLHYLGTVPARFIHPHLQSRLRARGKVHGALPYAPPGQITTPIAERVVFVGRKTSIAGTDTFCTMPFSETVSFPTTTPLFVPTGMAPSGQSGICVSAKSPQAAKTAAPARMTPVLFIRSLRFLKQEDSSISMRPRQGGSASVSGFEFLVSGFGFRGFGFRGQRTKDRGQRIGLRGASHVPADFL